MPIDNSRDKDDIMKMMQGFPPAANHQVLLANWREPDIARWSFNHLRQLLPTAPMHPASPPTALATARQDLDDLSFLDARGDRQKLGAFLAASQSDCFAVMKDGKLVYDWFGGFGAPDRQHIVFSITKSMASLLAGVLVGAGVIDVQRQITDYLPELGHSAYAGATMRHLLDMQIASGFREDYLDTDGVFMAYRRASAWNPIEEGDRNDGLRDFLTKMPVSDAAHGTRHHYCSPHSDVLGWVIERSGGASFAELFSRHILAPCGAAMRPISVWIHSAHRVFQVGYVLQSMIFFALARWCVMAVVLPVNRLCHKAGLMISITSMTIISGCNSKMAKGRGFL